MTKGICCTNDNLKRELNWIKFVNTIRMCEERLDKTLKVNHYYSLDLDLMLGTINVDNATKKSRILIGFN